MIAGKRKTKATSIRLSHPLFFQCLTWVTDYFFLFVILFQTEHWILNYGPKIYILCITITLHLVLLQIREEFYFWILGDAVAPVKRAYCLSSKDKYYTLQTSLIGAANTWIGFYMGNRFWNPISANWNTFWHVFVISYILTILKDIFSLAALHKWMHENPWLYTLHKEHHTVNRNAQSAMAYHIDFLDLVIENICAPFILELILYLLGQPVKIHAAATLIASNLDVVIHSINPYTICLFNPILDYFFRCNVAHQIHHSVQTANYTFIPYHHLKPGSFKKELDNYNSIMETSFEFVF